MVLIPLDGDRQWYRYHHLFAGLLNARLRQTTADQVASLHGRASAWSEQMGWPVRNLAALQTLNAVWETVK